MNGTLFGREPALVLGFIGTVLTFLAGVGMPGLTAGAAAAIVALLTAIVTAALTRPIAPALYTGIITAAVALGSEYGLNVSEGTVAGLSSVVLAAFALFGIRSQVSPKATTVR